MTSFAKVGRPRRYDLKPLDGFANEVVAWFAAALDELRDRVEDQVSDLTAADLSRIPNGTDLSIAALVVHLVWAELGWVRRITDCGVPADLMDAVEEVGRAVSVGERATLVIEAETLLRLCRRVRDEVTVPSLRTLTDVDGTVPSTSKSVTPRGVLMHLVWHWTYHSGQIGLLRELVGHGYTWTFGSLAPEVCTDT